jgi:maleate cis-trans isomerase
MPISKDGYVRLGLIFPEGGGEYEYYQFAEAVDFSVRPYLVVAHLAGGDRNHEPAALRETGAIHRLEMSARSLAPLAPDAALWACTSGSFIVGRAGAEAQAKAIEAIVKCPASSTSLAFVAALARLGIGRVGVVGSYLEETSRAFVSFLGEFGIEAVGFDWHGAPGGRDAFATPTESFVATARTIDGPGVEAILIPDTAVAGLPAVRAIEAELGKPALAANQVTIWQGLGLAGWRKPVPGFGRLLTMM